MRRVTRAGLAVFAAAGLGLSGAAARRQAQQPAATPNDPRIVFLEPTDGQPAAGPLRVRVQLQPEGAPFKSVRVYVDGQIRCTIDRPPIGCEWDAGDGRKDHMLHAVVTLPDGRSIRAAIATKRLPVYTDNVDVDVIHVTTLVRDAAGNFVHGLKKGDFRITDRGVPQTISFFPPPGDVPLEITVAIDISGSMAEALPGVKAAVKKFVSALRPGDKVHLMAFNDNTIPLAGPSVTRLEDRLRKIDQLAPWGGTALYDVIVQAIDRMKARNSRSVLVVFTDGEDRDSHILESAVERRLEMSDVVLYAIGQGQAATSKPLRSVLNRLAESTAGLAFFGEGDVLDGAFATILDELANQYLLGFAPTDYRADASWHPLTVDVPGKNCRVRARQGYRER